MKYKFDIGQKVRLIERQDIWGVIESRRFGFFDCLLNFKPGRYYVFMSKDGFPFERTIRYDNGTTDSYLDEDGINLGRVEALERALEPKTDRFDGDSTDEFDLPTPPGSRRVLELV